ncbi:hypothetical protein NE865_12354 [Phthorimaea operculella]|nr:hypothetical protein NE865_12354 [Phthorimaea operculella]
MLVFVYSNAPHFCQDPRDRPMENMTEDEARAERKRRQQRAQEEFRLRMSKQNQGNDEKSEMSRAASSFDALMMDIPTQDIEIEQTGDEAGKRRSPGPDGSATGGAKRRSVMSRLDIVTD